LDSNSHIIAKPIGIVYTAGKICVSLKRSYMPNELIGDENFISRKTPLIISIDNNDSINIYNIYDYPYLSPQNKFYPGIFKQYIYKYDEESVLLAFSYTPAIIKLNCKTGEIKNYYIKSYVIDSLPLRKELTLTQPFYQKIFINDSSDLIFRRIIYGSGENLFGYLFFDKNFKRKGEQILPKGYNFGYSIDDKLCLLLFKNEKLSLNCFKYNFLPEDKDKWIEDNELTILKDNLEKECKLTYDSIYNENVDFLPYLRKFIKDSSFAVIVVPTSASCHGCMDLALASYSANKDFFAEKKIYLLLVDNEINKINQLMKSYLLDKNNNFIVLDTLNDYFNYQKHMPNIHFIIVDTNQMTFSKVYRYDEMNKWQENDLREYLYRNN
jgi:hypothetical protein